MTLLETKVKLKEFGFTLSYSGYEGMIMDNQEINLRVVIWRDSEDLKFSKEYDLFEKPMKCIFSTKRDFLLEDKINPIEIINEQIDRSIKSATLRR